MMVGRPDRLVELWSARLPHFLDPDAPTVADALADGVWLAPWPRLAAYAPVGALFVGALALLFHAPILFCQSLPLVAIAMTVAILNGTAGAMLFGGYATACLTEVFLSDGALSLGWLLRELGAITVAGLTLAVPTITIPRVAHGFVPTLYTLTRPTNRSAIARRAALYATACPILIFMWSKSATTMIRSALTIAPAATTLPPITPISAHWRLLVACAAGAAIARVVLEEWAAGRGSSDVVHDLQRRRWSGTGRRPIVRRLPKLVRISMSAVVVTLLLAGTFEGRIDAFATVAATMVLSQFAVARRMPRTWITRVSGMPRLLRLALGFSVGYAAAGIATWLLWTTGSLRVVPIAALLTLTCFILLFPERAATAPSPRLAVNPRSGASAAAVVVGACLSTWVSPLTAQVAGEIQAIGGGVIRGVSGASFEAIGCARLNECYSDPATAAFAATGMAAMIVLAVPDLRSALSSVGDGMQQFVHDVRRAVSQSIAGTSPGTRELVGSVKDAWNLFGSFAQHGTVRPHPDPDLRAAGGYIAELPGGGTIGFRPFSKAGPAVLDMHGLGGFEWLRELRYTGVRR